MKSFRPAQAVGIPGHGVLREFRECDGWRVQEEAGRVLVSNDSVRLTFALAAGYLIEEVPRKAVPAPVQDVRAMSKRTK